MNAKKMWRGIVFFFEELVPVLCFATLFVTFIIGVSSRYLFKMPVEWTYEVSLLAYMWTTYFGASYAYKRNDHVVFGLVYDGRTRETKRWLRILYNLIIAAAMVVLFYPATLTLLRRTAKTGALLWPQKYVFLPFAFMLVAMTLRCLYNIYMDIGGRRSEAEDLDSDSALIEKAKAEVERRGQ